MVPEKSRYWGRVRQEITNKKIHTLPSQKTCEGDFHHKKIHKFVGEIRQYHEQTTKIDMYYCDAQKISKLCKNDFFGYTEKIRSSEQIEVTPQQGEIRYQYTEN